MTTCSMNPMHWAGAMLLACAIQAAPAAQGNEAGTSPDRVPPNRQSDMTIQGATPREADATVPMSLLGGDVGKKTVNGVRVELYVLLAGDMDKLRPTDPDHAFTVTLRDETTGAFIKTGEVSVSVKGAGDVAERSVPATMADGIFRSTFRLQHPGQYQVKVGYKVDQRSGAADFAYRFEAQAPGANSAHHHH